MPVSLSFPPLARLRILADRPPRPDGEFVVYWMISARRLESNFALDRVLELALELARPFAILEPLRCDQR